MLGIFLFCFLVVFYFIKILTLKDCILMFTMNIYTLYFHILLKEVFSSVIPVSTSGRQLNLQNQSLLLIRILGCSNKHWLYRFNQGEFQSSLLRNVPKLPVHLFFKHSFFFQYSKWNCNGNPDLLSILRNRYLHEHIKNDPWTSTKLKT